jgi:hypothetical protein
MTISEGERVAREDASDEAMAAMPAMLRAVREVMYLDDSDPRRVAAMAEKRRVLALIERASGRE